MNVTASHRHRIWFPATAAALTVWGMIGVFGDKAGYTGALYWHDYTIPEVRPGGPLDEAGFQPGDSVVRVEGISVEELGMYSRWPRSLSRRPGESIEMVVERGGQMVAGRVVFRESTSGVSRMRLGALLIGLSFLWCGVWAFFTTPSMPALRLATMGVVAGLALPGPNLGTWNGVRDHIQVAGLALLTLLLLRFFLFFPRPKRPARSRAVGSLLYAPWVAFLACLVLELIYHPRLYHSFGGFFSVMSLGYTLLAAAAVIHTAVSMPRTRLRESGMAFILIGLFLALVPNVVLIVMRILAPALRFPGSSLAPFLLAAIPVTMALGVKKDYASGQPTR